MSKFSAPTPLRDMLRKVALALGLDHAISFVVLLRIWQFLAGPISMLAMAAYVSPEVQGYYYTFSGLMALQVFFELGLHGVIVNHVSHTWTHLTLTADRAVIGDTHSTRRLSAILRFMIIWYCGVAALFTIGVGGAGLLLFGNNNSTVHWELPWLTLVILNGVTLWSWSLTTFLEGCNQYTDVGRLRLQQALIGNLFVWFSLAEGLELWSLSVAVGIRLLGDLWLIGIRYNRLFTGLLRTAPEMLFTWRNDILPLQWRMALRGIFGYLLTGLFTPVLFEYHGAVEAGRFGMTWSALSAIEQAAHAWIGTRTARYCNLVVKREFSILDHEFRQGLAVSSVILIGGILSIVFAVWSLECDWIPYATQISRRVLPWKTTFVLGTGIASIHLIRSLGVYLLAHQEDPLLRTALSTCLLAGIGITWTGIHNDVLAMACVFSGVLWLYATPLNFLTWNRYRRERPTKTFSPEP